MWLAWGNLVCAISLHNEAFETFLMAERILELQWRICIILKLNHKIDKLKSISIPTNLSKDARSTDILVYT